MTIMQTIHEMICYKGGPGSGHHGHAGRPGEVGGSAPKSTAFSSGVTGDAGSVMVAGIELSPEIIEFFDFHGIDPVVMEKCYNFSDKKTGIKTKIADISWVGGSDDAVDDVGVLIMGDIRNAEGEHIGEFGRIIQEDSSLYPRARHAIFFMRDGEGNGFGARWMEHCDNLYLENGIKSVLILATSVGGYAWAKMGFDFDKESVDAPDYQKIFLDSLRDNVTQYYDFDNNLMRDALAKVDEMARIGDVHSWDIASFTFRGVPHGRNIMMDSEWYGIKYIDEDDPTWEVARLYYGMSRERN